ncbi:MAG: hypothetical protein ACREBV_06895 [Candidatus Zixiibacteriota bacterium]
MISVRIYFAALFLAAAVTAGADQTLKEKMTPPADSAERENVRVWIQIDRPSACRLTVNILDSASQVIRHLIDYAAPGGVYNFYWNKKDDSGRFVEPGTYGYEVDDCGKKKTGGLRAEFKKWERESEVTFEKDTSGFVLELLEDSADVRIEWYNMKRRLVARLFLEDDMKKGTYYFNWTDNRDGKNIVLIPQFGTGLYVQKVLVDDFIHEDTIRWMEK